MHTLSDSDYDALLSFAFEGEETGRSKFPGMTYEQGVLAVLDVIAGNTTVEEATE